MSSPRIAPPPPKRARVREFTAAAKLAGIRPMPWQRIAARIVLGWTRGRWTFREAALVVARQNGKTTFLVPRIVMGLLAGERIMHTAQNRELPREVLGLVADVMSAPGLSAGLRHNGIRLANGQEEIRMLNGGRYRIVAPTRGGARGPTNDLVIVDEAREMDSHDFIAAAEPTLTASRHPQFLYLSNAGDDRSIVLNALRRRAELDPRLAYLEWSAAPDRSVEDREGWREANPALGITIREEYLEAAYQSALLGGTLGIFETEHLCRWVTSLLPRIVSSGDWERAADELEELGPATRPAMGVAVDPASGRASAVLAWEQADGSVGLTLAADVTGDPLDVDALGVLLAARARALYVPVIGFDPVTDADLARHFGKRGRGFVARELAAASERFASTVQSGRLRHAGAAAVGADLAWTARAVTTARSWRAVRVRDERPITAALAAIRAVWLATEPDSRRPQVF